MGDAGPVRMVGESPVTAAPLVIVAPSDAQLACVRDMCAERGYPMPPVYSRTDASWIIDAIRTGAYYPPEWADSGDVPF